MPGSSSTRAVSIPRCERHILSAYDLVMRYPSPSQERSDLSGGSGRGILEAVPQRRKREPTRCLSHVSQMARQVDLGQGG